MKVLIAIDGSAGSEAAVEAVALRPLPPASEVRLIAVVEIPFVPTPETWALPESYFAEMEKGAKEQAQSSLDKAVARLGESHADAEISTTIVNGHPKEAILDESERWGAELVVVGSHGYRGWQRFLLGSVSQAIASHAACSVEIVRQRRVKDAE